MLGSKYTCCAYWPRPHISRHWDKVNSWSRKIVSISNLWHWDRLERKTKGRNDCFADTLIVQYALLLVKVSKTDLCCVFHISACSTIHVLGFARLKTRPGWLFLPYGGYMFIDHACEMFILSSTFSQDLHESHALHCAVNLRTYNNNYKYATWCNGA